MFRVSYIVAGQYKSGGPVASIQEAIDNAPVVLEGCAPIDMCIADQSGNVVAMFTVGASGPQAVSPPDPPCATAVACGDDPDDIGKQVAELRGAEAKSLADYLKTKGL